MLFFLSFFFVSFLALVRVNTDLILKNWDPKCHLCLVNQVSCKYDLICPCRITQNNSFTLHLAYDERYTEIFAKA